MIKVDPLYQLEYMWDEYETKEEALRDLKECRTSLINALNKITDQIIKLLEKE